MWSRILLVLIAGAIGLGLQACAQKPSPEESCNFVQNGDQQRVSWGSDTPVVMYIDSSVPEQYFNAIRSAADTWNRTVGREVLKIGGWTQTNGIPAQDGANVIYLLRNWEADKPNEQARTTVYWANDRIYEADVRINAKNFEFFTNEQPVVGEVDVESLVLHEFGHVLGLAHNTSSQSVMAKSLANATLRRKIGDIDTSSVKCEY
jgi:predicted Zn-dependent protease